MYFLFGFQTRSHHSFRTLHACIAVVMILAGSCASRMGFAQDVAGADQAGADQAGGNQAAAYVDAVELLPDATAGMVRIADLPGFCVAWKNTHLGRLGDDPLMQPFIEAQRAQLENYLNSIDNRIGLRPQDLYEIASGEVVAAWLSFDKDKFRPFSLCVVADIRGREKKAETVLQQIDNDLKAGGATRTDVTHQGQVVRVYTTKPKPGQLKIEEIAITFDAVRVIAADRRRVVTDLLDAIAGSPVAPSLAQLPDFKLVQNRVTEGISPLMEDQAAMLALQWFARPFSMGRILREVFEVDRGNQVDILRLLEGQGFNVIKAAGGSVAMAGKDLDLLHRGFILAPPAEEGKPRFELAARMLQMSEQSLQPIPAWVPPEAGSFARLNWSIENAFWASETLINEAFGDDIFRPMIEGIRDDEEGPQIDLAKDVLPHLADQVILMTDNTLPATVDSERILVAIRVSDAAAIKQAIKQAMEVEPDASLMDVLPGVEIWRVQRGEGRDDFERELFGNELSFDEVIEDAPPLLEHWAIALVDQGAGSQAAYLVFSSHPDLLVQVAKRIQDGANAGLGGLQDIQQGVAMMKSLGADTVAMDRFVRLRQTLRVKYELFRQGQLKDSDSLFFRLLRRVEEEEIGGEPDPLQASKLPSLDQIEQHLPSGGSYVETTADGWLTTGFLLK